ncbi:hypothetical protein Trydic_g17449 [Trypoxylus dichotomus]
MDDDELIKLSKEDLIFKVKTVTAQNDQLKNIIAKQGDKSTIAKQQNKPYNFEKCTFRHVLIKFLYLGWNYNGYTVQEDTNETVENYLFKALIKTCLIKSRSESNYHRCGRTDKGVSSFSQVISIDIRSKLAIEDQHKLDEEINYCLVLNRVLPRDIQCIAWSPTSINFSARFDCKHRTYKYFFTKGQLDIEVMRSASNYLLGTHDFRNLCKMDVGNGVTKFIRNIMNIEFNVHDKKNIDIDEYTVYEVTITGQAFLWHQIRCIMGILFLIGQRKEKPEVILELLDVTNNPRKPEYHMASEIPLNLYECMYENEDIDWQYDDKVVSIVIENLTKKYTIGSIQTAMIKSMITDLKSLSKITPSVCSSHFLLQGVKPKVYTPVMKRQKCVVNFHVNWCEPCHIPKLQELVGDKDVDLELHAKLVHIFKVKAVPAVLAVKDGLVIDANTLEKLLENLTSK